ncbi:MAG: phytoene/squalene synthase family protein [Phycisphaerales bacterium]|nr:phytoene/squalene synthase family protein [Phycisphaerales bacterium]
MEKLYEGLSHYISKKISLTYSTSFGISIQCLSKKFHQPLYALYAFVRLADELVDTYHHHSNAREEITTFKELTYLAIKNKFSCHPVLFSFQETVHQYQIPQEYIEAFFTSMEMDIEKKAYTRVQYDQYIYGSAEVVGLMSMKIYTENNQPLFNELKPAAQALGRALQKVNFLRDIKSDYYELGRVYFPNLNIHEFINTDKKNIEAEIQIDFNDALKGIHQLPKSSRTGVLLAYLYYVALFKKIMRASPHDILTKRLRISFARKMMLLVKAWVSVLVN